MSTYLARIAALMFAILVIGVSAGAQEKRKASPGDLQKLVAQGDKLLADGKLLEARAQYLAVIKEDPANAPVALKVARVSEDLRDFEAAATAYQTVVANTQGTDRANAQGGLAGAYAHLARYQEAIDQARQAIALDPSVASAHVYLAYSLVRTGASQEGLAVAGKAVELSPTSAMAHATLGEAQLAQGHEAEAERAFQKALELDPKMGEAHAGLGEIKYRRADYEGAIASATKALELSPGLPRVVALRGRAYLAAGRTADAYRDLSTALTTNPNDPELHLAFAQLQRKQGNRDGAINSYGEALRINPDLREASLQMATLLADKGDYAGARQVLEQAVKRAPDFASAYALLGTVYEKQKEPDAALQAYERAVSLDPKLAAAHHARGRLLREYKKDIPGAVASLEQAASLEPANVDTQTDLGVALYEAKQTDRALELLQKATAAQGYKNAMGFAVLGLAFKDKQDFAAALGGFVKASELAPDWWLPRWGAAWSYFGQIKKGCPCGPEDDERVQKAKEQFDKMVSLQGKDPVLEQRLDALLKGQKVK